jgi:hypothetical protein
MTIQAARAFCKRLQNYGDILTAALLKNFRRLCPEARQQNINQKALGFDAHQGPNLHPELGVNALLFSFLLEFTGAPGRIRTSDRRIPLGGLRRRKKAVVAGWFRDQDKAVGLAAQVQGTGVHRTLNPCQEALLARAHEPLIAGVGRTKDAEIHRIRNLLVDLDPLRPEGISSTNAEHEAALEMAEIIRAALGSAGWPEPLMADSGNGGHLVTCPQVRKPRRS